MIGIGNNIWNAALRGGGGSAPASHTITASAGANGSISPSGAVAVEHGANQQFTFAADSGYYVSSLTVDGSPASTTSPYTFTNVTADHTIAVAFAAIESARTAMGTAYGAGEDELSISGPAGGCAAGDLIVVCVHVMQSDALAEYTPVVTVDGAEATNVALQVHGGGDGRTCAVAAFRCSGSQTGAVKVSVSASDDMFASGIWACASRYTNISSATPNVSATKYGSTGTVYSTDAVSTTVKCVCVGLVSKFGLSTGTWREEWTNGQGVDNRYSEGYGLNLAAASRQTYKDSGANSGWGAIFAAFPVRTT